MNITKLSSIIRLLASIPTAAKEWVFANGKFNVKRASVVVFVACLVVSSVHYIQFEETEQLIELVDEIADIIECDE